MYILLLKAEEKEFPHQSKSNQADLRLTANPDVCSTSHVYMDSKNQHKIGINADPSQSTGSL